MADKTTPSSTFFSTKQGKNNQSNQDITNQIKSAIDMSVLSLLKDISSDLRSIMVKVTGEKPKDKNKKTSNTKAKDNASSKQKKMTAEEIKAEKKIAKEKEKAQSKVNKNLAKQEKKVQRVEDFKKGLGSIFSSMNKAIKGSFTEAFKTMTSTSAKILSSNSMVVDKGLRDLQVGMGLDSSQAMSLSGAMSKMGIDKSDLAYLTEGQRGLLSELTGTMEDAYASTDMSAISEMGNSLFKIQALFGTLTDIVNLKIQEVLTKFQPVLDMVTSLLYQLIDSVMYIFDSPEFETIITLIGEVVSSLVSDLMPILQSGLSSVVDIVMNLLIMLLPLITELMPIVTQVLGTMFDLLPVILPIIATAIDFVMQLLEILVPIIVGLLPIVAIVLQTIGSLFEILMPIIIPAIQMIGKVIESVLPIIYIVLTGVYNAIITLYNWFVKSSKEKDLMSSNLSLDFASSFVMPEIESNIEVGSYTEPIANSYADSNNVDSVVGNNTTVTVDANFNSTVNGEASTYAQEVQKTNYKSSTLLASIIEENT